MRELIVTEMVSLDGVMEAPGGEAGYRNAGWTFNEIKFAPAAFELKGTEQEEAGALLLGRTSYQAFAPVWPQMDDSARSRQGSWVTVMVRFWSTAVELWSRDCRRKGLQEEGLIDKLHLLVFPVLLGQGRRLFSEAELSAQHLTLEQHESYSNGIQKMIYRF